jgi:hypothetical protein
MERALTREYWGRFLIELLQNARDAWLSGESDGRDGILRIRLTKEPALVVCNEGDPLTTDVVLQSISKFGESPKPFGTAIGHKGIGFKAVLELTRTPRLFSRLDPSGPFDLKVRFDPDEARQLILERTPRWSEMVDELISTGGEDGPLDRIPVLRFPLWDENPPSWLDSVAELDDRKFNTVVVLPYDKRFEHQLGLSEDEFVERVRRALAELSDEVVLLLAVFGRVVIEDEIADETHEILRSDGNLPDDGGLPGRDVSVIRDNNLSSRWWLFERNLPGHPGLEGDIAVGVRITNRDDGIAIPVLPTDETRVESSSDCFHLFFPTRIRTHLPVLLHAYFEVDAGRKAFAEDRETANRDRLEGLRQLAVDVTRYLVQRTRAGRMDLSDLALLFAKTSGHPDDPSAARFRDQLLRDLDHESWVTAIGGGVPAFGSPAELLIDARPAVADLLPAAFPPKYVWRRTSRLYAATSKSEARRFLEERNAVARNAEVQGLDIHTLAELLRPAGDQIWNEDMDQGFRALLQILDQLDRDVSIRRLLDELRTDSDATFIPVVGPDGKRRLRQPGQRRSATAMEGEDEPGGILARVSSTGETPLVPPQSLGLDFLPDGVVDADLLSGIAARLGIRPYQTESILDALAAIPDTKALSDEHLRFIWRLLLRERLSAYSVVNAIREAMTFQPGRWFWGRPGAADRTDANRDARRARALADLPLPTAVGTWRPAGELAFGLEWSTWAAVAGYGVGSTAADRAATYADLAEAAPHAEDLVAGPDLLSTVLSLESTDISWAESETGPDLPAGQVEKHRMLLHAFLLRLGCWEVPPVVAHVDYRHPRPGTNPPWGERPDWAAYRAVVSASAAEFIKYGHRNVYFAEDYRLGWPLRPDPRSVRAVSRGASMYGAYLRAELFCPQCRTGGTWHTKRYSSSGDARIPSFLSWQLTHIPWLPTSTGGAPLRATLPGDAWQEDDRPDVTRMQQSWMRFLPLVGPEVSRELAILLGVTSIREGSAKRVSALLYKLRAEFESAEIVRDRRVTSFEGQSIGALCWRLYEQLTKRDSNQARAVVADVGVLAALGKSLGYRPPKEVRHDDGSFNEYKRYFIGQVPFSILPRDLGTVADQLGIPRFDLDLERVSGGSENYVTQSVRPYIHDRAAEFLALQAFHPLGTQALQLDGRAFTQRAERLRLLEVVQVDDLVLRVAVRGTDLVKELGAGRRDEMFLEDRRSPPVLYHDIKGSDWIERFRVRAGTFIAALLETSAYAATFQLLLQHDGPDEVEEFLDELSITADDVDLVRQRLDLVSGVLSLQERHWWSAVLPLLGASASDAAATDVFRSETQNALNLAPTCLTHPGLSETLWRAGAGELVRRDTSPEGALAALEEAGVNLYELDDRLRVVGDHGLTVDVAGRLLAEWKHSHGREVAAILAQRGIELAAARSAPEQWRVGGEVAYNIGVEPREFLEPVVRDLKGVGISADPAAMVGADASLYLASLIGETPDTLTAIWRGLFDEAEQARLDQDHAQAWKIALRPILIAARTRAGDQPNVIRSTAEEVDRRLAPALHSVAAFADGIADVLDASELLETLQGLVRGEQTLAAPVVDDARDAITAYIDAEHLDRVIAILRRGRRQYVDQIRRDIETIRDAGIAAKPFSGSRPPQPSKRQSTRRKIHIRPRRAHDQRVRDRLGAQGERTALATVLNDLLGLPSEQQNEVIVSLVDLLLDVAEEEGEIVAGMVAAGRAAVLAVDEDDRLENLARLLWVSQKSDDFGFDLLGYLSPYEGVEPCGLLLEVKNSKDRSFLVSAAEWRRAEEQAERYAFFVVVRSDTDVPASIELIPNPPERLGREEIGRSEDTWLVRYAPNAANSYVE